MTEDIKAPPIDFAAFVLSMSTAALQHLEGKAGEKSTNLVMAQQTIDILAMLDEKTKGNLNEEEAKLLGHVLYDLRMRFVETKKQA